MRVFVPLRIGVGRRLGWDNPLTSPYTDLRRGGTRCGGQWRCGMNGAGCRLFQHRLHSARLTRRNAHGGCAEKVMLRSQPAPASLVVCSTCRFSQESRADTNGHYGGALFADAIMSALDDHACRGRVELQPMPCLFACTQHCTVYVRSAARLGYVLGRFEPSPVSAVALLDYLLAYLASIDGVVPYANWPPGVKGHFLARVPPEGQIWQPA